MSAKVKELSKLNGHQIKVKMRNGKYLKGKLVKIGKDHIGLSVQRKSKKGRRSSRTTLFLPFRSLFFLFPFFFFRRRRFFFF